MAYNKTVIFQNIGKGIKKFNKLDAPTTGFKATLDAIMSEIVALYNDSEQERKILNLFSNANRSDQQTLDSIKSMTVSIIATYLTTVVREDLSVVGSTSSAVLEALFDAMEDAADSVKENTVSATTPAADNDNAGNGTVSSVATTQQCRDNNDFELTCTDASTKGSERWSVTASRLGGLGTAVTAEEFESESAGVKFTISAQEGITETGDQNNQLSNWSFTGAQKGVNTDPNGKLYVTLADTSGTRTVSCYKDASRTQLVCQGSRSGNGTVTLSEQNNSGLSGSVSVTYTANDSDIELKLEFRFAVGDKFYFSTSITAKGNFQFFFVENFGKSLPSAQSGNETVTESWAE
jgi:hypothetical protein